MKLACGYARCSTDDQAGSLPAQWEAINAYAKNEGFQIVERFEDDGVSGTSLDRPGLNALIQAAANGAEWTHVLVWDRSRLGRPEDPREAIAMTYQIEQQGRTITPLHGNQQTDNPILNTILEAMEFGQAGEESIRKSRDVLRGQREQARHGSLPHGRIPYGFDGLYTLNGEAVRRVRRLADGSMALLSEDGNTVERIVPKGRRVGKADDGEVLVLAPGDAAKVAVVRRIFQEYNSGFSIRSIARRLNEEGIPSPKGGKWGRPAVTKILDHPAYKGTLAWNRRSASKFHTVGEGGEVRRVSNPTKRDRVVPEEEWVTKDKAWEGLVSEAEWNRAHTRRREAGQTAALRGRGAASSFLASELLTCVCGARFHGTSSVRKGRAYHYYRCGGKQKDSEERCRAKLIRREIVDGYLERRIQQIYFEPAASEALWHEIEARLDEAMAGVSKVDRGQAKVRELAQVEGQITRLVDAIATGVLGLNEADGRMRALRKQKEELEAEVQRTRKQSGLSRADMGRIRKRVLRECREQLNRQADLWPTAAPEQRKQIVRAHVAALQADTGRKRLRAEFYPVADAERFCVGDTALLCGSR